MAEEFGSLDGWNRRMVSSVHHTLDGVSYDIHVEYMNWFVKFSACVFRAMQVIY
jgi:hypothetical protein